jgi:hypothetical protein
MEEIIVKSQQDYDNIPEDYKGLITINSERHNRITLMTKKGSSVVAWENSSVVAWENSSVVAWGNVQVVKHSSICKIELHGNARIVEMPKELLSFMDFYGIKRDGVNATIYKAVSADLKSFYRSSFQYEIGKTHLNECDTDTSETCGRGLHVAYKEWAINYGKGEDFDNFKVLEVSVPIDKIVYCPKSDGKVRTSELTVVREVPIEEWGVRGKIIAKQRARKANLG